MAVFEIQKPYTVSEVLAVYRQVKQEIELHGRAIQKSIDLAEAAGINLGGKFAAQHFVQDRLVVLKQNTWRALLAASGVEKILSVSRMERFEEFLLGNGDYHAVPEPSEEAVQELLSGGTVRELFAEMIREAFNFLRPGALWNSQYKTNRKNGRFQVGKKIVLERIVHETPYYVDIYSRTRRNLIQVDKIFHLLDGKPFPFDWYNSPLVDGLNERKGQTDYFKWERFSNGNLHLTFLRDDLLKQFNEIAGRLIEPSFGDGIAV